MKLFSFVVVGLLMATAARAECELNASDAELKACLEQDLRDSDKRINEVYTKLRHGMTKGERRTLRDEQRAWLKRRDRVCKLDTKESNRERWLRAILADQLKTVCVARFTFGRAAELIETQRRRNATAANTLPPARISPMLRRSRPAAETGRRLAEPPAPLPAALRAKDDGYNIVSRQSRRRGRWYFEVWLDTESIFRLGGMLLTVGWSNGKNVAGKTYRFLRTPRRPGLPPIPLIVTPIRLGFAIDVEDGLVYHRLNGKWREKPGSGSGLLVRSAGQWRAYLSGSAEVADFIKKNLIKVNLGEQPFAYAMPDGYLPLAEKRRGR